MLARLAQELSARQVRWQLPLPNSAGSDSEHIFHNCEAPAVALSTALIIPFVFRYFGPFGELILTLLLGIYRVLRRPLGLSRAFFVQIRMEHVL